MTLLILAGAFVRLPGLAEPLLEGAAGKQTHIAMVARNLHRGRATWTRPRVDDVGKPGYFVKEFPVVPILAAAAYSAAGEVDERYLRLIGIAAWLLALPIVAALLRRPLGPRGALWAGLWFVLSPMGIVYSRAAMNDAPAVAMSLAALAAVAAWRRRPGIGVTGLVGLLVTAAFLMKPHSAFWLGPAAALLTLAPGTTDAAPKPSTGQSAALIGTALAALGLAGLWYLHAAQIHRVHPVPGATVAEGWIAPGLLLHPGLYLEIGRQALMMVFTPIGALLAVLGTLRGRRFRTVERALMLWGGGVVLQCLVFAPRMFDDLSRGTEYYQLALVPTAALLIARGLEQVFTWSAERRPAVRATTATLIALLITGALLEARAASRPPAQYGSLLADCAQVRAATNPAADMLVLADRGGTVLYYCDRRGQTFSLAGAVNETIMEKSVAASPLQVSRALASADYVYVPFPELLTNSEAFLEDLSQHWADVPLPDSDARLFARPDVGRSGRP
ncbi:MAG: glycosyltransferase family 39 protein [Candidatus Binatia bacterium]|nr:glycosyltransferase family 39 protein [Candidatus Binatia bacterium]